MSRSISEIQAELDAVDERIGGVSDTVESIVSAQGIALDDARRDSANAWERLTPGRREAATRQFAAREKLLDQRNALRTELLAARHAEIAAAAADDNNVEMGGVDLSSTSRKETPVLQRSAAFDGRGFFAAASAAIGTIRSPRAQDRLDAAIRAEPTPAIARWIAAAGDPNYATAFLKVMADPDRAMLDMSDVERAAWSEGRTALRAMDLSDPGSLGGYMVPLNLDPTLVLTDAGAINPLREIARVETIVGPRLRIVTTAGVTAAYRAEGSDIPTGDPTLLPPEVKAEQASAAVKISFEAFDDILNVGNQLGRAFQAAKDTLEADRMALGSGTDEPQGIVAGLTPDGGAPSGVSDLIAIQNDLGARWQPSARWLMDLTSRNQVDQFVAEADASQAKIIDASGNLLHRPVSELSTMGGNVVYGSIRDGFLIVDRIGMRVEIVQHLPGATADSIAGYRALLTRWRSGSGVVVPEALRLLGTGS